MYRFLIFLVLTHAIKNLYWENQFLENGNVNYVMRFSQTRMLEWQ